MTPWRIWVWSCLELEPFPSSQKPFPTEHPQRPSSARPQSWWSAGNCHWNSPGPSQKARAPWTRLWPATPAPPWTWNSNKKRHVWVKSNQVIKFEASSLQHQREHPNPMADCSEETIRCSLHRHNKGLPHWGGTYLRSKPPNSPGPRETCVMVLEWSISDWYDFWLSPTVVRHIYPAYKSNSSMCANATSMYHCISVLLTVQAPCTPIHVSPPLPLSRLPSS